MEKSNVVFRRSADSFYQYTLGDEIKKNDDARHQYIRPDVLLKQTSKKRREKK
ncbi:hypothetical protein BMWSH_4147 [Priestia megaterium WSH-002]|uniref:Uncharacterized protein n=1 Tax=Priestia megaterium (strain WSH-002) TaxID=1006007 RepID=A0A8D4BM09_PRIMW|nr:hypothetical protein BMWSH_4147 [Priestia megaterium WSH-002]